MSAPVRLPSRAGPAVFLESAASHTQLLEKRRQMFEVEEALKAQKQEYARREEAFRQREEGLRKKDLDLQEALIRFNAILTENEAKKVRAEKRAGDEMRQTLVKEDEIAAAARDLDTLKEETAALNAQKLRLEPYTRYMEAFQRARAQEYPEVMSILERFSRLRVAHNDLLGEQEKVAATVEDERKALARVRKAASTQVLTSENIITRMKQRLEESRARVARLQSNADESSMSVGEKALELGQILQSVLNLHSRCVAGDHGRVIRHTPADVEIPGAGSADAAAAEGEGSDAEGASSDRDAHGDAASAASPGGHGPASPMRAGAAATSPAKRGTAETKSDTPEEPSLVDRVAEATALLRVVGKYVTDFDSIVKDYPAWQTEQRRRQAERDLAAAAEASRLAAAREERKVKRPGTRGVSPSAAGRGSTAAGRTHMEGSGAGGIGLMTESMSGISLTGTSMGISRSFGGPPGTSAGGSMGRPVVTSGARTGAAAALGGSTNAGAAGAAAIASSGVQQGPLLSRTGARVYVIKGAVLSPQVIASITGRASEKQPYSQARSAAATGAPPPTAGAAAAIAAATFGPPDTRAMSAKGGMRASTAHGR